MADTPLYIPELERRKKFTDYRKDVWGDSYNWSWVRKWEDVKYVVIHHSVTEPTSNPKSDVDYIAQLHKNRGWGGIGYHFVITADGMVWYVGDISTARANVLNMNEKVIGICLVGDFRKYNPTDEQIISAHDLSRFLIYDVNALPNLVDWSNLVGHKDLQATECPGPSWKGATDSMYERIKNRIPYTPQTQPSTVQDTTQPQEDLELHKKVDKLVEEIAKIDSIVKLNSAKVDELKVRVDDVKRDTEELYTDRETIIQIREEVVNLEGRVKESIAKQTSIETSLKAEIRAIYDFIEQKIKGVKDDIADIEKRLKVVEDKPIPLDKRVKILYKIGSVFVGKIVQDTGGENR